MMAKNGSKNRFTNRRKNERFPPKIYIENGTKLPIAKTMTTEILRRLRPEL